MRGATGQYVSSDFSKSDCGPIGSNTRLLAGYFLYKKNSKRVIIISGGRGECSGMLPKNITLASVLKRELLERGVPEGIIIEENGSNNTYQQLMALDRIARENKLKSALIVSSTHHLPRIEAMLNYVQDLDCLRQIAKTVSADEVVIENDPSWKSIIKRAYLCEPILSVIKKEIEGVRQIKSGVYKYK